jgi:hypothetical protein
MKYKADLERILTDSLREKEPLLSQVLISDKGEFAVVQVADKYTERKLKPLAKEFLRDGPSVTLGQEESMLGSLLDAFLEPE